MLDRVAAATAGGPTPGLRPFAEEHGSLGGHWIRLAGAPLPGLDDWSRRHLEQLAALDALAPDATAGTHLVHVDTRTDNVLLAASGPRDDVVVDWPGAALGAPWIDLVGLLPALHLDGGPPPAEVFAAHPPRPPRRAGGRRRLPRLAGRVLHPPVAAPTAAGPARRCAPSRLPRA